GDEGREKAEMQTIHRIARRNRSRDATPPRRGGQGTSASPEIPRIGEGRQTTASVVTIPVSVASPTARYRKYGAYPPNTVADRRSAPSVEIGPEHLLALFPTCSQKRESGCFNNSLLASHRPTPDG